MSTQFGFGGMVNRSSKKTSKGSNDKGNLILVRVTQITFNNKASSKIGSIKGEAVTQKGTSSQNVYTATPENPNFKIFPVINEYVFIRKVFEPNKPGSKYVYSSPISVYGFSSPHVNPYPSLAEQSDTLTNSVSYQQSELGAIQKPSSTPIPLEVNLNNEDTSFQNSLFIEKENIHPLYPYMGDFIIEGRWGNSIRFGSTTPAIHGKPNNYSTTSPGDPITIIRNGQDRFANSNGYEPIIENIKNDLSSIYLTSKQKISNLSLTSGEPQFSSYTNKPITPSQFNKPQILLNSDRIIIDAKTDSVLLSAQKSVGLLSNESINIETKSISIQGSKEIKIGNNNLEPVLLGDQTAILLEYLIKSINILAESLKLNKDYPSGIPLPDSVNLITGDNVISVLQTLQTEFLPKIKSTKVKVE